MGAVNISGYTFSTCSTYESPALRIADTHSTVTIQLTTRPRPDDLYTQKVFTISNSDYPYLRPMVTSDSLVRYEGYISSQSTSGYSGISSISTKTSTAISESLSASTTIQRGDSVSGSTKYDTTYSSNYNTTSSSSINSTAIIATGYNSGETTHSGTASVHDAYYRVTDVTLLSSASVVLSTSSTSYSDYRSTFVRSGSSVLTGNSSAPIYNGFELWTQFASFWTATTANRVSSLWTDSYTVSHCRQTSNGLGVTATFGAAYGQIISNSSATWEKSAYTAAFGTTGTSSLKSLGFFKISDGNIGSLAAFILGGDVAYTEKDTWAMSTTGTNINVFPRITLRPYETTKTSLSGAHGMSLLKSGNCIYGWMHNTTSYDGLSFSAFYAAASLSTLSIADFQEKATIVRLSVGSTIASSETQATSSYVLAAPFATSANQIYTARTGWLVYGASTSCRFTWRQTSYNITAPRVISYTYTTYTRISSSVTYYNSLKSSITKTYSSTRQGNTTSTKTVSTSTSRQSNTSASTTTSSTNTSALTTSTHIQSALLALINSLSSLCLQDLENASFTITSNSGNNTVPSGGQAFNHSYVYGTSSTSSTSRSSSTNTNGACTIPNLSSTTVLTQASYYSTTSSTIGSMSSTTSIGSTIRV